MVEKIFFNGNILTQDKKNPTAQAFAVSKGKIVAVGYNDLIQNYSTDQTRQMDLSGKTVLPGFNDAHIHIWKVGNMLTYMLDLRDVRSIEEMQQMLLDYSRRQPEADWIQARGFNEALFPDGKMPDKYDLDKVISDKPVAVVRTCAHQLIVNTKALEVTGINAETHSPYGGEIKKFPTGELKGHFTETAMGLVTRHIPQYSSIEYRNMILAAQEELLSFGITTATDPAVMPDLLEVYKSMERNKELKIRINAIPVRLPDGETSALPLPAKYSSDFLNVNTVKFFADGGLSGKTAALKRPYKNSNEKGVLRIEKNLFKQLVAESQNEGFRIATHAIGDAALDLVLDTYEELFTEDNLRNRVEHVGLPSARNFLQMQKMKISAVMQPVFLFELGKNFRNYLDDEYLKNLYPLKSILDYGINLSLSSDAPVVRNFDPMQGIRSGMERKDSDAFTIGDDQKISAEAAINGFTIGSAVANGDDENKGSIERGKWADFIVLNKKIDQLSGEKFSSIVVEERYVSGNKI